MNSEYNEIHRKRFENTIDIIKEHSILKDSQNVLSLGNPCGFKEILLNSYDVHIETTTGDLRSIVLYDNLFELVLCLEVIEHIKDVDSTNIEDLARFTGSGIKNMLQQAYNSLKPGGYLLISTPNLHCYKTLYNWVIKDSLLTYHPHPRELSEKYVKIQTESLFESVWVVYKNSWWGHGVPEDFVTKGKAFLDLIGESSDNREEDNVFFICKK